MCVPFCVPDIRGGGWVGVDVVVGLVVCLLCARYVEEVMLGSDGTEVPVHDFDINLTHLFLLDSTYAVALLPCRVVYAVPFDVSC